MNIKEYLKDTLSERELTMLVRSYDVVGDLAIIIIPPELVNRESVIAGAVLALNRNVKVVLKRDGTYSGEYRQIPLTVIGGEDRKETICIENEIRLNLNPEEVYYSVRSSSERKRIANCVQPGESVLVMFSGIGPYPLVISKHSLADVVVGIEKNPHAHSYATKSLKLNKKIKNVKLYEGDVKDVLGKQSEVFDRVVMPLPKSAHEFLADALGVLSSPGVLHYYGMYEKQNFEQAVEEVRESCKLEGRVLKDYSITIAGHCGPGTYRICVDCTIL